MANYKWEVDNNTLILKDGDTSLATISGGLDSDLLSTDATYTTEDLTEAGFLTFKAAVADDSTTQGVDESEVGVITLKSAILGTSNITLALATGANYELALDGANAETGLLAGANPTYSNAWELELAGSGASATRTANYHGTGTIESWTLDVGASSDTKGKKITYAGASDGSTVATITGLKATLNDTSLLTITAKTGGETKDKITLAKDALPESTGEVQLTAGDSSYVLALAADTTMFDATKGNPEVTSIASNTATITRTQSAGWKETVDDTKFTWTGAVSALSLATVSGLGASAAETDFSISTDNVITIAQNALGKNEDTKVAVAATATNDADRNFSLALSGTTDNKLGFAKIDEYWKLEGTTAKYMNGREEGWTLVTTVGTDKGKIVYTAQNDNTLATITNLASSGVVVPTEGDNKGKIGTNTGTNDAFVEGITVSGNNITLAKAVLTKSTAMGLSQGKVLDTATATTYALVLANGVATSAIDGAISLEKDGSVNSKVNIKQAVGEYWTLGGTTSITHTDGTTKTLAEITNVNTGVHIEEYKVTEGGQEVTKPADIELGGTDGNEITITVGTGALTTDKNNKLTVTDKITDDTKTFKLALAEGISAPGTTPATDTIRLKTDLDDEDDKKTLSVIGTLTAGYKVDSGDQSITYEPENASKLLAKVKGLEGFTIGDTTAKLDGNVIKLDASITIGKTPDGSTTIPTATLTNEAAVGEFTPAFTLGLLDTTEAPDETPTSITLGNPVDADSKRSLDVQGTLTEGWQLSNENKTLAYKAAETVTLATITGLNTAATNGTNISVDADTKTVTVKRGALVDNAETPVNVKITPDATAATANYEKDYKLALYQPEDDTTAGYVPGPGKTVDADTVAFGEFNSTNGELQIKGTKTRGWTLDADGLGITYNAKQADQLVATVKGLASTTLKEAVAADPTNGTEAKSANIAIDKTNNTITLGNGSLDTKDITVDLVTDTPIKFAIDTTIDYANGGFKTPTASTVGYETVRYWTATGTTARYYSQKAEGWTLGTATGSTTENTKVTYTAPTTGKLLAEITNLSKDISIGKSTVAADAEADGKFYDVIGTGEYNEDPTKSTFVKGVAVSDTDSNDKLDTITLSKNVLGTGTMAVSTKATDTGTDAAFKLLLNRIGTEATNDLYVRDKDQAANQNIWVLGSTATYKKVNKEYWTLADDSKSISYTAQTAGEILATITGLNSGITEADITASDMNATTAEEIAAAKNTAGKFTITLNKNALTTKNVTFTSGGDNYALAVNTSTAFADRTKSVAAPVLANAKWSLNNNKTTATYKADVTTAGYEAKSDGTGIIYTPTGTSKEIAKVTGLKGGSDLKISDDEQHIGVTNEFGEITEGLAFGTDADAKQITVTKDVLGTSKVTVSGTNYTLDFNGTGIKTGTFVAATGTTTAPAEESVWRVSSVAAKAASGSTPAVPATTTATYKKIIPAYYTKISDTEITYTQEADSGTKPVLATVTGLKSGLKIADDGKVVDASGTEVLTLASSKITLKEGALTTTNVAVTKGTAADAADYTLSLGDAATTLAPAQNAEAPLTFVQDATTKTTVYLKGTMNAGYNVDTNSKGITYTAASTNYTFATITGLKNDLTSSNLNGANAGIYFNKTTATQIDLDTRVLGTTPVAITNATGFSYTLGLDATTGNTYAANTYNAKSITAWEVSGSTATYKSLNEAYYDTSDNNSKITYTKRTTGTDIVKLTNLNATNLKVENDKIAGITETTTGGKTTFTLSGSVLNKGTVTVTNSSNTTNYDVAIATDVTAQNSRNYWTTTAVTGTTPTTTAKYVYDTTEGYTLTKDGNGKVTGITWAAAKSGNTATVVATITGLKGGITATNKSIAGITADDTAKTFKLSESVLGTTKIAFSQNPNSYHFALDTDVVAPKSNQLGWKYDSTKGEATLYSGSTTAGHALGGTGSNTEVNYTAAAAGTTKVATVKGLKDVEVDANTLQIKGVTLGRIVPEDIDLETDSDNDGNKTNDLVDVFKASTDDSTGSNPATLIQLSKSVLVADAEKLTTLKNEGTNTYNFAFADDVAQPKYTRNWTYKSGTATLAENLTAGYAIDTNATEIAKDTVDHAVSYYATDSLTTTIAGINGNANMISSDKTSFTGITGTAGTAPTGTVITAIPKTGAFEIADSLLNKKAITLKNGKNSNYTLALATSGSYATAGDPFWEKTATSTTATYKQTTAAGYSQASDTKISYSATPTTATLATVKGLKKEIAAASGQIEGISVATSKVTKIAIPSDDKDYSENEYADTYVITLSKDVLAGTHVTVAEKDYSLKLAAGTAVGDAAPYFTYNKKQGTATVNIGKTEGWTIETAKKDFTPEGQSTKVEKYVPEDIRKITYVEAKPVPLATISNLKVNNDNEVDGIKFTEGTWTASPTEANKNTGIITLSSTALNKKEVAIAVEADKQKTYGFTIALDGDVYAPADGDKVWSADGKGTAKYQYTTSEGYTLKENDTKLAYSPEETTVLATIKGLNKSVKTADSKGKIIPAAEIAGISIDSEPEKTTTGTGASATTTLTKAGTILLSDDSILSNKVTIDSEDYVLGVTEEIASQKFETPQWYLTGTTARYKSGMTAGLTVADDKKTVQKTAETPAANDAAQITITGLKSGVKLDAVTSGIIINNDDTVTVKQSLLGTGTIELTNGVKTAAQGSTPAVNYEYKFDASELDTAETQDPVWSFSGGTATLKQKTTAGYALNEAGTTLTYSKEVNPTVATVKGLNTKLKLTVDGQLAAEDQVDATTTTVGKKKVTTYSLKKDADSGDVTGTPAITLEDKIITLTADALTTKNVNLSNGKDHLGETTSYKLTLGSGVTTSKGLTTEWTVKGATATYKSYQPVYYELENEATSVKYNKSTDDKIYATVTGLNKTTTTADDLNSQFEGTLNGGVLTLNKNQLDGTSTVKIKSNVTGKDTFILALDTTSANAVTESSINGASWSAANGSGKATLKGTLTVGYSLAFGGKSITNIKTAKSNQTIATINGVAKNLSGSTLTGATSGNVITLTKAMLNTKNVTITTSKGNTDYTLALASDATAPTVLMDGTDSKLPANTDPLAWKNPKGTATLSGYVTEAGWTLSNSAKSITYTKANNATKNVTLKGDDGKALKDASGKNQTAPVYKATANLVTIKGLNSGEEPSLETAEGTTTVKVSGEDVSDSAKTLSVNGGVFAVSIDEKFNNKTVTGSNNADALKINGTGVSVTGGKGDDTIELGNGKNTIIYSNNDGNDVVADFTPGMDTLQIKSGTISVAKDGTNVIVKVGNGSITLTEAATAVGNTLTIENGKGKTTDYWVQDLSTSTPGPLLADDNYSMDAAQLSSIVESASSGLMPYDIDSGLNLIKKDEFSAQVSYTKDK